MRPDMNLFMGEYVVMPNHFQAIIGLGKINIIRNGLRDGMRDGMRDEIRNALRICKYQRKHQRL